MSPFTTGVGRSRNVDLVDIVGPGLDEIAITCHICGWNGAVMNSKKGQGFQAAWRTAVTVLAVGMLFTGLLLWRFDSPWPLLLFAGVLLGDVLYLLTVIRDLDARNRTAIETMAKQRRELSEQAARLQAIHGVADALSRVVELPEFLGEGLERAVRALGLDGGQIHLKNEGQDQVMQLSAVFGTDTHVWDGEQTIQVGECICGQAAADGSPIVVDDVSKDPRVAGRACAAGGVPSMASVPLNVQGGTLGVLTVRSCDPHNFILQDIELLTTIANFMAATLENARIRAEMQERIAQLSQEVQQLAIVEERHRIGREIHDGLAQTLGLLNMQIEMVKVAAKTKDWAAAEDELAQLDAYLGNAYSDVRQALGDLRRVAPQGETFLSALRDYVEEFGRRYDLDAVVLAENGDGPICFPVLVEVHLQRVIQEALANVRRHAAASRVEVRVKQRDGEWLLSVCDDGIGFDTEQLPAIRRESFGLVTMQERMESVGGTLTITSQPGAGTCIAASVPCGSED